MATREQLDAATAAEDAWREANVTGVRLTDQQRAEFKALHDETNRLERELAWAEFDAVNVPSVVLSEDEESVTCRLPRDVLVELLVAHESGISDEEHMAMALGSPDAMRVLKQILELANHQRPRGDSPTG